MSKNPYFTLKKFNRKFKKDEMDKRAIAHVHKEIWITVPPQKSHARASIFKDLIHGYFPVGTSDCVLQ